MRVRVAFLFVILAGLLPSFLSPVPALASLWPSKPTNVHVVAASHSSITVGLDSSTHGAVYRLYASTLKSDLYYTNIQHNYASSARRLFSSTRPRITATGLRYTTAPYYYRVVVRNDYRYAYEDDIRSAGLRPDTPTGLRATSTGRGVSVTWSSGRATGFVLKWSVDPSLKRAVHTRAIRGESHQYTPVGLVPGRRYSVAVRAENNATPSGYTTPTTMVQTGRQQSVKVMTFNILQLTDDGKTEPGGVVAPWRQRRPASAALIKSVNPDVVAVQEGMNWVGRSRGVRQVDDLNRALRALGATYRVAATEITYPNRGWRRTDNYILYKPSVYRAYAAGGHFGIGDNRFAAYQPLKNIHTGAKFLFVSTHLHAGMGLSRDEMRQREAQSLVRQVRAKATALHIPAVYGGDFNSNDFTRQFKLDGPGVVMRSLHVNDACQVAMLRTMARYDTMNEYSRKPLAYGLHIDYLWAPPGVAVRSWGTALRLSHGRYVGTIPSDHNPVYATMYYPY